MPIWANNIGRQFILLDFLFIFLRYDCLTLNALNLYWVFKDISLFLGFYFCCFVLFF